MRPTLPLALAVLAAVGCQSRRTQIDTAVVPDPSLLTYTPEDTRPVRDFDQVAAHYANGDTIAGSTGFRYEPKVDASLSPYPFADSGVFAANLVTLPYTLVAERDKVRYQGFVIPESHTANPAWPNGYVDEPPTPPGDEFPPRPVTFDESMLPPATRPAAPTTPETPTPDAAVPPPPMDGPVAYAISGAVDRPGDYVATTATDPRTVMEAVRAAGYGDRDPTRLQVTLTRGGDVLPAATLADLLEGRVEDAPLMPGDVLSVTER